MENQMNSKSKLFNDMGMKSCHEGDLEKGLKYFNTGLAQDKDSILLLYNKAGCLVSMGKTDEAEVIFKRVIKLCDEEGKSEFALNIKANSFFFLRDFKSAKIVLEDILKISPDDVDALISMAHIFNREFNYKEALKYLDRALDIDSQDPNALMIKGDTLLNLNMHDEARQCIDQAFELSKQIPYLWYLKGVCEANCGNHENAVEYYNKAIDMDQYLENAYFDLTKSLVILGKADEAKETFRRFYELHPEDYEDSRCEVSDQIVDMLVSHFSKNQE